MTLRIHFPLPLIRPNPYQPTYRELGDLLAFGRESILPHLHHRPETYGLQQVPQARLIIDGTVPDNPQSILINAAALFSVPPADTRKHGHDRLATTIALLNEKKIWVELIFGHRRTGGVNALFQAGEEGYNGWMALDIVQIDDVAMLREVRTENANRKTPTAVEELQLLTYSLDMGGTVEEAAQRIGMTHSSARTLLTLRQLPDEIKLANASGTLNNTVLEELIPVSRMANHINFGDRNQLTPAYSTDRHAGLAHPHAFINHATTYGVTKPEVRDYLQRLTHNALELIPDIAEGTADGPHIIQPSCKGCPARRHQQCFNHPCHNAKLRTLATAYWEQHLRQYPWSDNPADFTRWGWGKQEDFFQYVSDHPEDPHIVIGFVPSNSHRQLRPSGEITWGHKGDIKTAADALAYGYTKAHLPTATAKEEMSASGQIAESTADRMRKVRFQARAKMVSQIFRTYRQEVVEQVAHQLAQIMPYDALPLLRTLAYGRTPDESKPKLGITPIAQICQTLADQSLPSYHSNETAKIASVATALTLNNLTPPNLDPITAADYLIGAYELDQYSNPPQRIARIADAMNHPPFNLILLDLPAPQRGDLQWILTQE